MGVCLASPAAWAGTASIAPASVSEGLQISTVTLTYTVGGGGLSDGGGIKVTLPQGWWPYPQKTDSSANGYVSAATSPGVTFTLTTGSTEPVVTMTLSAGQSLAGGGTMTLQFFRIGATCPPPGQTQAPWSVLERDSNAASFQPLGSQPTQTLVSGPATNLGFSPWDPLTVVSGQASSAIVLEGRNYCGKPANVPFDIPVTLSGHLDYSTSDAAAQFSASSGFGASISSVTISSGTSQKTFYYRSTSVGNYRELRAAYNDILNSYSTYINRVVNILASGVTFSGVSVDNGNSGTTQTSYTLTPDNDGTNDFAYIRFVPSNLNTNWKVSISSDGFNTIVYERYGSGQPASTVQWNGRRQFAGNYASGNETVPNGTYAVKIEVPGLVADTSLSITVSGASIAGRVTLGGTGVANAWVNAQATSGAGYAGTMTDNAGYFTLNGLKSGQSYNLFTNFYDPNTQTSLNGNLSAVTAPAAGANIVFSQPGLIRVAATSTQPVPFATFGQANVRSTDYTRFYNGMLRFNNGSTTSDNGDAFNPSTWTVIAVQPGSYVVEVLVPGFGTVTQNVTATAGGIHNVGPVALTSRATLYGKITLPAPASNGLWVSVDGVKSGNTYPTVWGGAFFNVGMSTAVYSLYNVDPGTYTVRARVPGFVPVTVSTVVAGTNIGDAVNGGLDFSSFSTGGSISGSVTINGNTLSQGGNVTLWLSAYNASLGTSEFTQTSLTTHATSSSGSYAIGGLGDGTYTVSPPYLYGFELVPPGPKTVTVSGGSGTLNLTLLQNSGQLSGSITLPGANTDYSNVTVFIEGPNISTRTTPTSNSYSFTQLGSGFYTIIAFYETTGAQVRRSIGVVNGQTTSLALNLSAPTYSISGKVSIQTAFSLQSASSGTVTINTIADLLQNQTTQYVNINGASTGIPTARVEAFPKTFNSYGDANRDGFTNSFNNYDFKYGTIQNDGTYSIPGLTPGVWEVAVYPNINGSTYPGFASSRRILTITSANQSSIDFSLSEGQTVSGSISLPSGITDFQNLEVSLLTERGDSVQFSYLSLGTAGTAANSASYEFKNLADGKYVLMVAVPGTWDPVLQQFVRKYVAKPVPFEIAGADLSGLNITMVRAGRMVGKLAVQGKTASGAITTTLVTSNNTNLLSGGFRIYANADPWVEGGYREANRSYGTPGGSPPLSIDSNGQFTIDGLVAGSYNVVFRQDGPDNSGQGSVNLASYTRGQVRLTEGQLLDLGLVELQQGLSLSGTVKDESGNGLPNIIVRAEPSNSRHGDDSTQATSDSQGQFTLTGLNPEFKTYTIRAAPRPGLEDSTPLSGYGEVVKRAVDVTKVPAPTLEFTLSAANGSLSGSVSTVDSGPLAYPDDKQQGYPVAAIYLKRQGVPASGDDPLGEIRASTNLDGTYTISNLVPAIYDITVMSLEYKPYVFTQTITAGSNAASAITLQKGSVVNATLRKPDGTGVTTSDVQFAVAATADLQSILFGQITSDENTRGVSAIRFSGFETNKRYSILLFDDKDNITTPAEGRNLLFTTDTDEKTLVLTYQPSAPNAFTQIKKLGSAVQVSFFVSRSLRNSIPADDVASGLISVTSGAGTLSEAEISGDRRSFTVTYTPAADEQTATLAFSAYTADINPATGSAFQISKSVTLRFGQRATAEKNINPVFGGEVSLADADNDPSAVNLPANALLTSDGDAADADANYTFAFTATEDLDDVTGNSIAASTSGTRAARLSAQMSRGAASYVSEAYSAIRAAAASTVNPLSSFYSVLLPAGLSHTLNTAATLTLQYDSGADPTTLNVYYYDETGKKYLIENNSRSIDTVNRTISVNVSHFSTFVVLQNSASVVFLDGTASAEGQIEVFNFPNPFDLQPKTKTLSSKGGSASMSTDGTIIRYTFPASKAGRASIEIFDITGNKVRGIDLGTPTAATYHYVTWDGKNDSGSKVASGVYLGVLKVGGEKKVWKMAVIK